ncbi:MAG: fasciclin domain-containing protein [Paludibacter sp.]|nr:fasciclin domain-containing protein [Paludibacter sp.]
MSLLFLLGACQDEWYAHYNPMINGKSDKSISEYLKSRHDLSLFAKIIESNGYDSILNSAQTYTVWAPLDSSLRQFDLADTLAVSRLLKNHITQFSIPTSGIVNKDLIMLNGKILTFSGNGSSSSFGGKLIVEPNIAMKNGIVHVLGNYVPYKLNAWEFMNEATEIDSMRNYINSLTTKVYDASSSFNKDGVFVDSIFKEYNPVLTKLCKMKNEDSTYVVLFPNNQAWSNVYNNIYSYYKFLPSNGGTKSQISYTRSAIINNLFYNSRYLSGLSMDTAVTTSGTIISNFKEVIEGVQPTQLSNGLAYKVNPLKYKTSDLYFKEIRKEAESIYAVDTLTSNYALSPVSNIGTGVPVSNGYYLTCTPKTESSISKLFVRFPIPNTLSAKYNIYCQFVPSTIAQSDDSRSYKVKFYMTYVDANGNKVNATTPYSKVGFDANHQLTTNSSQIATFITDGTKPTKMLVAENFQFPFCDIGSSIPSVFLKVENVTGTSTTEKKNYNRTLRIDCIILEPVQ